MFYGAETDNWRMGDAQIVLEGNVGGPPRLRKSAAGVDLVSFSVAVQGRRRGSGGEQVKADPTWFRVTSFGQVARAVGAAAASCRFTTGTLVVVSGTVARRDWTTDAGEPRVSLDVAATHVALALLWDAPAAVPDTTTSVPVVQESDSAALLSLLNG